ncbi:Schizosaccharomyces pombe specific protein [Schizosaccharomyces pombe]|uniref:Uncharacterized protein C29A3.21 n=1 Tax=Schizosaccharomyces pombe (strain 972 / ATCC 24843) TaxID=284812 RepID=YB8L_SCHPO|nr:uncharacterized protein SPBC29A3.21 [Schizosaccharomyces pombe]Q9C0X0.1 RecName: Full=Uncharacterized protein C29A3.21 [Schizosaccharomyces pombe 972h-]CAC35073.1 sequence orphan [Schizosaccharomyces pombe]|eukprot:NP_001342983.1 uncharacterized protein SPBC29A3.21 [Schizosaccharomyces pombe]
MLRYNFRYLHNVLSHTVVFCFTEVSLHIVKQLGVESYACTVHASRFQKSYSASIDYCQRFLFSSNLKHNYVNLNIIFTSCIFRSLREFLRFYIAAIMCFL